MILHTFNKTSALRTGSSFVQANDHVLLMEDGVYALLDGEFKLPTSHIYALDVDVTTRGLSARISHLARMVNYQDYVELCCDADSISNWF